MLFNGLSGSDLVVFNALAEYDLPTPVPASKVSHQTGYCTRTVLRVFRRLEDSQIVCRHREGNGLPYTIDIVDDYAFPNT